MAVSCSVAFRACQHLLDALSATLHSENLLILADQMEKHPRYMSFDPAMWYDWQNLWGDESVDMTSEAAATVAEEFIKLNGDWGLDENWRATLDSVRRALKEPSDSWLKALHEATASQKNAE